MTSSPYRYPASDLDRREALLSLLGSFWNDVFTQAGLVESLLESRARQDQQTLVNLNEAAGCLSRQQTPVLHAQRWLPLTLLASDRNRADLLKIRYGEPGLVYGDRSYTYGSASRLRWLADPMLAADQTVEVFERNALAAFPLPHDVRHVRLIASTVGAPSVVLTSGVDFVIDEARGTLVFRTNPFEDSRLAPEPVYTGAEETDQQLTLWLFNAQTDKRYLQSHVAYPLQVTVPSAESAKQYLNAVWDGLVEGTGESHIRRVLAAVLDIELVQHDRETVEAIDTGDADFLWIITDQHAYRFQKDDTPLVAVGDVVFRDQSLTKALQFFEFNRGEVPPADEVPSLQMPRETLGDGYRDGLAFVNAARDVTLQTTDGHAELRFPLGGWPDDVERFWREVHTRGISQGMTLAEALDTRTNKVGQPTAAVLPTTINPLEFLVQNHLRNNAWLAKLDLRRRNPDALPLSLLRALRWLQPPHTWVIVLLQLDADPLDIDGTETDLGGSVIGAGGLVNIEVDPAVSVDLNNRLQNADAACLF